MNYGFIKNQRKEEEYVFGDGHIDYKHLQRDGQWDLFLPEFEGQAKGRVDTKNCVAFATINIEEALEHRIYDVEKNYSDRYVGILAGTGENRNGNSPQKVAETIRKVSGLIDEELLPFDESIQTWDDYYTPDPPSGALIKQGSSWIDLYNFGHDYVTDTSEDSIKQALEESPLGAGTYGWYAEDGLYRRPKFTSEDNHYTVIYGFEDKEYWKCFDTYANEHKRLAWDYGFSYIKRYSLKPQTWWSKILINLCL